MDAMKDTKDQEAPAPNSLETSIADCRQTVAGNQEQIEQLSAVIAGAGVFFSCQIKLFQGGTDTYPIAAMVTIKTTGVEFAAVRDVEGDWMAAAAIGIAETEAKLAALGMVKAALPVLAERSKQVNNIPGLMEMADKLWQKISQKDRDEDGDAGKREEAPAEA